MSAMKKLPLPKGKYIKNIVINDDSLDVQFEDKKKIAILFICLNEHYWPYIKNVIEDCKKHFLPQHSVDYYIWTDIPKDDTPEYTERMSKLISKSQFDEAMKQGIRPPYGEVQWWPKETIEEAVDFVRNTPGVNIVETEPVAWPAPTLMRYHLFLNEEEKLKDYEYIFYMDADMRVVERISDEILGPALTVAPHPGYAVSPKMVPPYEPDRDSTAYIHRLHQIIPENGKARLMPFYAAGGFQGGTSKSFLKAMHVMKANIDKDFNNNYVAIWNDESHWNKYLWEFQKDGGQITFLDVSYVYPDSLIEEYYIPLWGKRYTPKIITLTKHFSLSAIDKNELLNHSQTQGIQCPTCGDPLTAPGQKIIRVVQCSGKGGQHQVETQKL
jgi:hypothetical protein